MGDTPIRTCPDCGTGVPYERRFCPRCKRFVSGGKDFRHGFDRAVRFLFWDLFFPFEARSIGLFLWEFFLPISLVFGVPEELENEVSLTRIFMAVVALLVVGGLVVLVLYLTGVLPSP